MDLVSKLSALRDRIKNNPLTEELKQKYSQLTNRVKESFPQTKKPIPHTQLLGKLKEYKTAKAYNPFVRPEGEKPVSDGDGVQAELDRAYKKDPSQYHDNSQQAKDMENKINKKRNEATNSKDIQDQIRMINTKF